MKRYQKLVNYFLHYYVTETIHTTEGRRDVEKLLRKIIKEARADARKIDNRRWVGNHKLFL
jgi:hypothetical protein